ncbi:MAG TPA: hypothetical protein PK339_10875, partial [Flavitalea sp.]|nr:hypothetical protein [Flavitalea sp.]
MDKSSAVNGVAHKEENTVNEGERSKMNSTIQCAHLAPFKIPNNFLKAEQTIGYLAEAQKAQEAVGSIKDPFLKKAAQERVAASQKRADDIIQGLMPVAAINIDGIGIIAGETEAAAAVNEDIAKLQQEEKEAEFKVKKDEKIPPDGVSWLPGKEQQGGVNVTEGENSYISADENNQKPTGETGLSDRGTQEELGGSYESNLRKEIAARLEEGARTDAEELGGQRKIDQEKRAVLEIAKERDIWVDDLYSLGSPHKGGGNENTLALGDDGKLYKSNNLSNSEYSVSKLIEQVEAHNKIFPETRYEIVGFTGLDNGEKRAPHIEVVLSQPFIPEAEQATREEISAHMQSLGFEKVNESTYKNDQYTVSDLHPRNVLKDGNGVIYVIDNIISSNATTENASTGDTNANQAKNLGRILSGGNQRDAPEGVVGTGSARDDQQPEQSGQSRQNNLDQDATAEDSSPQSQESTTSDEDRKAQRKDFLKKFDDDMGLVDTHYKGRKEQQVKKLDAISKRLREAKQEGVISQQEFEEKTDLVDKKYASIGGAVREAPVSIIDEGDMDEDGRPTSKEAAK